MHDPVWRSCLACPYQGFTACESGCRLCRFQLVGIDLGPWLQFRKIPCLGFLFITLYPIRSKAGYKVLPNMSESQTSLPGVRSEDQECLALTQEVIIHHQPYTPSPAGSPIPIGIFFLPMTGVWMNNVRPSYLWGMGALQLAWSLGAETEGFRV